MSTAEWPCTKVTWWMVVVCKFALLPSYGLCSIALILFLPVVISFKHPARNNFTIAFLFCFLVAPSPERSDLSGHYGVCLSVCKTPPVKGKIFDTRFGSTYVWTKKFLLTPPPPTGKGKIFWHQIWLDTCSDPKKFFSKFFFCSKFELKKIFWRNLRQHQIWPDVCSDQKKIFFLVQNFF